MVRVEDHHVIQAFAPNGSDDPFDVWILPRGTRCDENLLDVKGVDATREVLTVDAVAVTDQIPGDRVPWKRFDELSAGPFSRRVFGDVEVNDTAPLMTEHEKHEQDAEPNSWHREEVDGDQALEVIVEERPPTWARWLPVADHVLGNGRLGQIDAEL